MSETGPAFPAGKRIAWNPAAEKYEEMESAGLTKREYAAIHLKVPNSGTGWLDEMIREANRNELAAKAMQGLVALPCGITYDGKKITKRADYAEAAFGVADAMLAERGRK